MKKALLMIIVVILNTSCTCKCINATEETKIEYGALALAVTFSSDKVIGEYGDRIPDNFNAERFMQLIEHKIPDNYYKALSDYKLVVDPKGKYYLLKVYDPKNGSLIMFDYSCTPELDGPVYQYPQKYDVNNLAKYDKCLNR